MKLGFTLRDIKIEGKATVGEVSVNMQYDAKELVEEYGLVKTILKELPELVADLGTGSVAFQEMDDAITGFNLEKNAEDSTAETKATAMEMLKSTINKIKDGYFNKAV